MLFTNPESLSLTDVWAPVFESSGIASMAFVPPSLPVAFDEWPTLGEMISSGKRVVVFMDFGAETGGVDYILPEFEMVRVLSSHLCLFSIAPELMAVHAIWYRSGSPHLTQQTRPFLAQLTASKGRSRRRTTCSS